MGTFVLYGSIEGRTINIIEHAGQALQMLKSIVVI